MSANPVQVTPIVLTAPSIPELAQIGEQLQTLAIIAQELTEQASRAVIDSETAFARGTDFLTLSKTNATELETLRRAVKKPVDTWAQKIQDTFLPIGDIFKRAATTMQTKMLAYRQEQDRIAREEAERQRAIQAEEALARAAELEAKGNTAAAEAVLDMATAPLRPIEKTEARRGDFGGKASIRATWTADIINKREFLKSVLEGTTNFNLDDITVSQAALNKLASNIKVACEKNGVKIYTNASLTVRS